MKKIKISQLPLYSSLKGLFTIGTDSENRSVKVSLEFIEEKTNEAVKNADDATKAAQLAKTNTEKATQNAQDATEKAKTATTNANEATRLANEATRLATEATSKANSATDKANKAATDATKTATDAAAAAMEATDNADKAAAGATKATEEADEATKAAQLATEKTIATLAKLIPSGLTVSSIERITLGNVAVNHIEATLTPNGTMPNIIFISDNKAVKIDQKGRINVVGLGASEVQIIPTCNTALAKTIIIRVESSTLRLGDTRKQLRLTESGAIMLN